MKAIPTLMTRVAPLAAALALIFALAACAVETPAQTAASAPTAPPATFAPAPTFAPQATFAPAPTFALPATFAPPPTYAPQATFAPAPTFAAAPTYAPPPTYAPAGSVPSAQSGVVARVEDGSAARYLVGEELVRLPAPIVAVGETADVSGAITFGADGVVDSEASKVSVGMGGFVSDEDRRDNYVRNRIFDTRQFPDAELVVRETPGLPWPLPESGEASFQIVGDLTIQGVSRSVTWDAAATFSADSVEGSASTTVTFDQFEIAKPALAFIISVEDEIRLEMDIIASIERN